MPSICFCASGEHPDLIVIPGLVVRFAKQIGQQLFEPVKHGAVLYVFANVTTGLNPVARDSAVITVFTTAKIWEQGVHMYKGRSQIREFQAVIDSKSDIKITSVLEDCNQYF